MLIGQFGTFDVDNYGDLLFPYIARWRLPEFEWVHVSPVGGKTGFDDSLPCIGFNEACQLPLDAIVVGGGNIISSRATKLVKYTNCLKTAYPSIWMGAAALAEKKKIPLIFNGPSIMPNKFNDIEKSIASVLFGSSAYISFRDRESATIISATNPAISAQVIPDTVFDLSRMWPAKKESNKKGYFVIHVNRRYLSSPSETAKVIDRISELLGITPLFVPIGPCHGDIETALEIKNLLKTASQIVNEPNLHEYARLISSAAFYIGSSMHGFITALSYDVPALLVLQTKEPKRKFYGVLDTAGISYESICKDWNEVIMKLDRPALLTLNSKSGISESLDYHWDNMRTAILNGKTCNVPAWMSKWKQIPTIYQFKPKFLQKILFDLSKIF